MDQKRFGVILDSKIWKVWTRTLTCLLLDNGRIMCYTDY